MYGYSTTILKNIGGERLEEEVVRVRIPRKDQNEILGVIEQMLGASRVRVRCVDGKVRMGRILES